MKTFVRKLFWGGLICCTFNINVGAQNPIVPAGKYCADPSARRWEKNGKIYIYGSRDESKSYYCSYQYDVLSSSDMKNWTVHPDVFASKGPDDQVSYNDELLFAPDCICKDGTYYLYYCMGGIRDVEGVATSTSPTGPFKQGEIIKNSEQIDPSVFIDEDGQAYLFWGQFAAKAAKLKPNMKEIDLSSYKDSIITEKDHFFHEGVQILKRNGIYYLVYAHIGRRGMPTCIGYSMSKSVMGPYEYKGVIIDNFGCDPGVWNNHGSIAEFDGQWYVFYHRSTNGSERMRKACIEPIAFNDDGTINEVEMTTSGAGGPLDPFQKMDAERACYLTGNVRVQLSAPGKEELAGIENQNTAAYKYFDFKKIPQKIVMQVIPRKGGQINVYANSLSTPLLATVNVPPGDGKKAIVVTADIHEHIKGIHSVFMRYLGEEKEELFKIDWFKFE